MYSDVSAAVRAGSQSFIAACRSFKCPHLGWLSKPSNNKETNKYLVTKLYVQSKPKQPSVTKGKYLEEKESSTYTISRLPYSSIGAS